MLERLVKDELHVPVVAVRTVNLELPFEVSRVTVGEISPATDWSLALADIDVVVHLAGRAHVLEENSSNPLSEFRRINTEGTLHLARAAENTGIKRFVFISSIGVLGNQSNAPFTENDIPAPMRPFAISKLEAEQGLLEIAAKSDMEVVILRPPLVYGPYAPGNFCRLLSLVSKALPLPFGALHNKRSFVALDNLVDLIVRCIDHPAAANETFLVADGEDISSSELVRCIGRALGKPVRLVPVPEVLLKVLAVMSGRREELQGLCGSLQVDISKARELLGWEPPVSLEDGLKKAAEAFESDL